MTSLPSFVSKRATDATPGAAPPADAAPPASATVTTGDSRRNLALFLAAVAVFGISTGMNEVIFNNFLSDTYHISASARGWVELPRELPGFLVTLFSGALFFLAESRVGTVASLVTAAGFLGLAFLAPSFSPMLVWMFLSSAGVHLYLPVRDSVGVAVAEKDQVGRRLGQVGAASTTGTVLGCGLVWLGLERLDWSYRTVFVGASILALAAGLLFRTMNLHKTGTPVRRRLVFRWRYLRYYLLSILFGARKQVFLTFAPWVLIRVLGQPASTLAKLWIVASLLGIGTRALLGRVIDRMGERRILMTESVIVILVCLGYGFGPGLGRSGLWLIYLGYVVDQLLFAVTMARTTYLYKIIERPDEMNATISLGVTLDHAVSMTIPILGGLVWAAWGFPAVFLAAGVIALVNLWVAGGIRTGAGRRRTALAGDASSI